MTTTLYADRPEVRARQIITDLLILAWIGSWVWAARWLYRLVETLAVPGRKLEGAGNGIADNLADAGSRVDGVPAVGDALASPFRGAAAAARALAEAGQGQQDAVRRLALVLSLLLLAVPLGLVFFGWLPLRVRWIRRATTAAALRGAPAGRDLLALRALTRQPLRKLVPISPDPVNAWRRGDKSTVDALAALELDALGLHIEPGSAGGRDPAAYVGNR